MVEVMFLFRFRAERNGGRAPRLDEHRVIALENSGMPHSVRHRPYTTTDRAQIG